MFVLQKFLTKKIEKLMRPDKTVVVPPNSFCGVFDDDYCIQAIAEGKHMVSTKYTVTPPISLAPQEITMGYLYKGEGGLQVFYKLTIKYKITEPYIYLANASRGEYPSTEATSLVYMSFWNKNLDEIKALVGNGYVFQGPAADIIFNSVDEYGVKILSASCALSSIEEIRSVPHDENLETSYIRGCFYNSVNLTSEDLPRSTQ